METDQMTERSPEGPWLVPTEALGYCDPSEAPEQDQGPAKDGLVRYGFRIGSLGLLVPQQTASELISELSVFPVPNTPPWFPGLVNLRGNLVPVFDLRCLFALPDNAGSSRKLLVLDKEDNAAGVYVDGFPQPLRLTEPMSRTPSLPEILEEHVTAAYFVDDDVWLELNHRDLFVAVGQRMAGAALTG